MQNWCILTTRFGADIRSPSEDDLHKALKEVFTLSDGEHPNASLRLIDENDRMYLLGVYEGGLVIFEQWADSDFEEELAPQRRRVDASLEDVLPLWRALRVADLSTVLNAPWQ